MATNPTSFFSSVMSGIAGSIKGFFGGGLAGAAIGAIVGGLLGALTLNPAMILTGMAMGAVAVGTTMAAVGSFAGTVTGVVKSREAGRISEQDVVNLANIAFAQGVTNGIEMSQNKTRSDHAERYLKERAAAEQNPTQRVH